MRAARSIKSSVSRTFLAALITIALFTSAIPLAALSAAHSCSMPCCAGGAGGCETGACGNALFRVKRTKQSVEEKLCGTENLDVSHETHADSHAAHPVETQAAPQTDASEHCGTAAKETDAEEHEAAANEASSDAASSEEQTPADTLSAHVLVSPCPKDCCAGANSSVQSRRARDTVLSTETYGARPLAFTSLSQYRKNLPPLTRAHLKQLRPRAPPLSLA